MNARPADGCKAEAPWRAQWASLAQTGAPRREPVAWAYLQALMRRADAVANPVVRQRLDERLQGLVAALAERQARADASAAAPASEMRSVSGSRQRRRQPPVAAPTSALVSTHPLVALNAYLRGLSQPADPTAAAATADRARPDLRSAARLAEWWGTRSVEIEIQQALQQPTEQAGPLNSHVVAARAWALLHRLSPAYASCWVRRWDSLMWLEQSGVARAPAAPSRRSQG